MYRKYVHSELGSFEWDIAKDRTNRQKHGLSFLEAVEIFTGRRLTATDERHDYGETRSVSIGSICGVAVVVAVHTDRMGATRIISARRASRRERERYHAYLRETSG